MLDLTKAFDSVDRTSNSCIPMLTLLFTHSAYLVHVLLMCVWSTIQVSKLRAAWAGTDL